jgi:hypothetical protein
MNREINKMAIVGIFGGIDIIDIIKNMGSRD